MELTVDGFKIINDVLTININFDNDSEGKAIYTFSGWNLDGTSYNFSIEEVFTESSEENVHDITSDNIENLSLKNVEANLKNLGNLLYLYSKSLTRISHKLSRIT